MKTSTTLSHPWKIRIARNHPLEIFELLKETIVSGAYGHIVKQTKFVQQIEISTLDAVYNWVKQVTCNNENIETIFFSKLSKDGSCCKMIGAQEHPFVIKHSNTQENIQISTRHGCWNAFINMLKQNLHFAHWFAVKLIRQNKLLQIVNVNDGFYIPVSVQALFEWSYHQVFTELFQLCITNI